MTDKAKETNQVEENQAEEVELLEETGTEPQAELAELQQRLQEAEDKAQEHWDQVLRQQAELENTRRRAERDVQAAHKYALEKFVNELLPVKDSLEMGEAASRAEGAGIEKVHEGIELTLKMLGDVMNRFGVTEVNPVGDRFNPDLHQAMSMQDVPDAAPNTVVTVYQKGYQLNDRLVRPAMVVVAGANSGGKAEAGSVDETA
jgi:molecular chaperone GrpE